MKRVLLFLFFVCSIRVFSQDILYTTSGNKLQAKVLELNTTDIKYKDFSNQEGPTYVISKTDVVLIVFSNGTTQIVNANAPELLPNKTESSSTSASTAKIPERKPIDMYYLNKNLLSINALALSNGDVTLLYDRELLDGHLGLTFLGGYSFNSRMGFLNAFIRDERDNAKKKFDAGFGINFIPSTNKRVQYFVGVLGKYMAYTYDESVSTNNNQVQYQKANGSQLAMMVTNGWVYRISPDFNFKIFGSIGLVSNTPQILNAVGLPKVYLGYCFGYRF